MNKSFRKTLKFVGTAQTPIMKEKGFVKIMGAEKNRMKLVGIRPINMFREVLTDCSRYLTRPIGKR